MNDAARVAKMGEAIAALEAKLDTIDPLRWTAGPELAAVWRAYAELARDVTGGAGPARVPS